MAMTYADANDVDLGHPLYVNYHRPLFILPVLLFYCSTYIVDWNFCIAISWVDI